jgi:SAM-dependent methyltransferase
LAYGPCILLVARILTDEFAGGTELRAIEFGSHDPDGGFRSVVDLHGGFSDYIGIDLREGPGIDAICEAEQAVDRFGEESFDLVIASELLEHVRDWRLVVSNLKRVCRPGGVIVVSTRSRGRPYHAAPYDFWRYEVQDIEKAFSDCEVLCVEPDRSTPGILAAVRRPAGFEERDLLDMKLYSMLSREREADVRLEGTRKISFILVLVADKLRQIGTWVFSGSKKDLAGTARLQLAEIANLLRMLFGRPPKL